MLDGRRLRHRLQRNQHQRPIGATVLIDSVGDAAQHGLAGIELQEVVIEGAVQRACEGDPPSGVNHDRIQ